MGDALGIFSIAVMVGARCIWGVICMKIAEGKGRSGSAWFWWGFVFAIWAVIAIALKPAYVPPSKEMMNVNALREYKDLLDAGVISREEFEKKKSELMEHPEPTYAPPPAKNSGSTWICPECGRENPLTVRSCRECGREK